MKIIILAAVLMSFPWISHAKGWQYSNYDREYDSFSFWQQVENRQYRQQERINRGIENGQLTRKELKRLHRERKNVHKLIRRFQRQGYLRSVEKREVMDCLDFVSEKIAYFKHNDRYARRRIHDRYNTDHRLKAKHRNQVHHRNNRYLSWNVRDGSTGVYFRF